MSNESRTAELRRQIEELRQELNSLAKSKEGAYSKKVKLEAELAKSIDRLRSDKAARDALTAQVKALKAERDDRHRRIKEIVNQLREQRVGHKSEAALKREIAALEYRLETEVMSHEREKALMSRLKGMRQELSLARQLSGSRSELDALRAGADELHRQLQAKAAESQARHEAAGALAKRLTELRRAVVAARKEHAALACRFRELNEALASKLAALAASHSSAATDEAAAQSEKERELAARLARGEKLVTEDLLGLPNDRDQKKDNKALQ